MFTDDDRRTLYDALERSIGHDPASILMAHLAPVGWVELATKGDIAEVRGEISELRGEMAAIGSDLRGEMAALKGELRGEMAALKSELRGEIAELRGEIKATLPRLVAANIASMIAFSGLILGATSLG